MDKSGKNPDKLGDPHTPSERPLMAAKVPGTGQRTADGIEMTNVAGGTVNSKGKCKQFFPHKRSVNA